MESVVEFLPSGGVWGMSRGCRRRRGSGPRGGGTDTRPGLEAGSPAAPGSLGHSGSRSGRGTVVVTPAGPPDDQELWNFPPASVRVKLRQLFPFP